MMAALLARYRVADPERFRRVFDGFEVTRYRHGATGHRLMQGDDAHEVVVVIEFGTAAEARSFAASPERLTALDEAGVEAREDAILEDVETLRY
jgi:uncharacterized protein (DUF1330 family)